MNVLEDEKMKLAVVMIVMAEMTEINGGKMIEVTGVMIIMKVNETQLAAEGETEI